jgi:hypothetical protein
MTISRFCYVLTGGGWTRHARMTWLSIQSLRMVDSGARVTLVMDEDSALTFASNCPLLAEAIDDFVTMESKLSSLTLKSRDLRIRLREVFDGDFVYVDGDTVFMRQVNCLPTESPVSAILDFNWPPNKSPPGHGAEITQVLERAGWELPSRQFNGGVLFFRDCIEAREFCSRWHGNWLSIIGRDAKTDHVADQLAFDHTAHITPTTVGVACNEFNVMVATSPQLSRSARILHFFSSPEQIAGTLIEHLLSHLDRTGEFDRDAVERCRREGHPWAPRPAAWQYIRSKNYFRALLQKFSYRKSRSA